MQSKLFNVIVFYEDETTVRKYRKVKDVKKLTEWIEKNSREKWKYANVYDAKTKEFIVRVYENGNEPRAG